MKKSMKFVCMMLTFLLLLGSLQLSVFAATTSKTLKVTSSAPDDNKKNVAVDSKIVLTFSNTLNANSLTASNNSNITINDKAAYKVSVSGKKLTITPLSADLAANKKYTVKIKAGAVKDTDGNKNKSYKFSFTTKGSTTSKTFKVSSTTPGDAATNVAVNSKIVVTLSNTVKSSSVEASNNSGITINGTSAYKVSASGKQLTITPLSSNLSSNKKYTVKIKAGAVKDADGNKNKSYKFSFTTK